MTNPEQQPKESQSMRPGETPEPSQQHMETPRELPDEYVPYEQSVDDEHEKERKKTRKERLKDYWLQPPRYHY